MWKGEKYGILEQVILLPFLKTPRLYQKLVNRLNFKLLSHKDTNENSRMTSNKAKSLWKLI